jgi:hypothetical protein
VTLTLSPPVKIAALCGLLAVLLIPGALMFMGRSSGDSATSAPIITHHPFGAGAKTTRQTSTPAPHVTPKTHEAAKTAKPATPAKTKAAPAAKHAPVAPTPVVDQAAVQAALKAGLPAPLAEALGQHDTVVVSLYDPYSQVDGISFAEAGAGAALAGVGFVPLNVLSQAQVGKLTAQLGLLPDPGLLVYVRPATLAVKISGFADKETVAQAARNAAHGS